MADTGDWRMRRWEATHRRILTTALALFEEHGFEKVSVGQVASAAEVSVPTFYAHFASKEHIVMNLPTADDVGALLATQPADLPVGERIHRAAVHMFASMPPDEFEEMALRWRIIARCPALRIRAAEFERTTAGMVVEHLPGPDGTAGPVEVVQAGAYLSAYTAGLLAWADSDGERKLEETLDEAFRALYG